MWYPFRIIIKVPKVKKNKKKLETNGFGKLHTPQNIKAAPTPINSFWMIFIDFIFVSFKGLRMKLDNKLIPILRKCTDTKTFNKLETQIIKIPRIAVGYPTKHPIHNFNFLILKV